MANLKYRYLIIIILLAVTVRLVNGLQFDSSKNDDFGITALQRIPLQIGGFWQGQDSPLEEMVYEILETRAIIHRSYTRDNGDNVFLSIVHYSDTKVDFHAPEACLGGQGLKTEKTTKTIILFSGDQKTTIDVAEIISARVPGQTLTYYFYKSGSFTGSNYIKLRLNIAANKLFRKDASGSLIRISTKLSPGDKAGAELLLKGFLKDLFPHIQRSL